MENLNRKQLSNLLTRVFAPEADETRIAILIDVPNSNVPDTPKWRDRRTIGGEWLGLLEELKSELNFDMVDLIYFENVGNNNADFPETGYRWQGDASGLDAARLRKEGQQLDLQKTLAATHIILALTQFSATAPLKVAAKKYKFKAASMPGFSRQMLSALKLDFDEIHRRVMFFKTRLDRAHKLEIRFEADGKQHPFSVDLRNRTASASSGLLREKGIAGNLPSGEAYIVPYEGEAEFQSETHGLLPVQFEDEVVIYDVKQNRAVGVASNGKKSDEERKKLEAEPAYGNIAEIGFGVLKPFGIKPIGEILLDEKLGLHIAFGRSDHFGGMTSPANFNHSENVVHIDRIYLPEMQPNIKVRKAELGYPDGTSEELIRDGDYIAEF